MKNTTHSNTVDQGSSLPEQMQHRHAGQSRLMHHELRPRRKRGLRIDQREQFGDARVRAAREREEAHRFRQPQRQDRHQQ